MIELLLGWLERYPIVSIEDPLAEDDPDGFAAFTPPSARPCSRRRRLPGHRRRPGPRRGGRDGACNAVLIKPNQRGTLTETRAAWDAARAARLAGIVSARSGESEDVTIVHLAVGWGAGQLKVGSFSPLGAHGQVERGAAHRGGHRRSGTAGPAVRLSGEPPDHRVRFYKQPKVKYYPSRRRDSDPLAGKRAVTVAAKPVCEPSHSRTHWRSTCRGGASMLRKERA